MYYILWNMFDKNITPRSQRGLSRYFFFLIFDTNHLLLFLIIVG
jgi:hypothetical protein